MKVSKKYFHVVMATFMAFFMGGCMSGIVTLINIGFVDDFLFRWGKAFVFVFLIALPLTLLFTPIASKLAEKMTK
ncbi:DUF2798 domain-containing protein [Thalassotalea fusca]